MIYRNYGARIWPAFVRSISPAMPIFYWRSPMPTRDEVARQVAKRLGGKYLPHESPLAVGHEKLWNALIDSELRHEADELRIQKLREALRELYVVTKNWHPQTDDDCIIDQALNVAEALLSEEKK